MDGYSIFTEVLKFLPMMSSFLNENVLGTVPSALRLPLQALLFSVMAWKLGKLAMIISAVWLGVVIIGMVV